jgi:hypothetical protein
VTASKHSLREQKTVGVGYSPNADIREIYPPDALLRGEPSSPTKMGLRRQSKQNLLVHQIMNDRRVKLFKTLEAPASL